MRVDYSGISRSFEDVEDYVVFTVEPPWSSCEKLLPHRPKTVIQVSEVDKETLDRYVESVPKAEAAAGIGGGRAVDAAKYFALRTGSKFISVPTILAADAYLTSKAGVRIDGIVTYLGDKFPDRVVIDFPTIMSAPPRLNRAAVGDIYSAKISLMDWRLARDEVGEEYDGEVAGKAEEVLRRLARDAGEIRGVTENGIRSLVDMHTELNALQLPYIQRGKFWPQEGSEHLFFYTLEKLTGKAFIHGEVIGAGAIVATILHGEDPAKTVADLDSFGLQFSAKGLGITYEQFSEAVRSMKSVGEEAGARYRVVERSSPDEGQIRKMWDVLSGAQ